MVRFRGRVAKTHGSMGLQRSIVEVSGQRRGRVRASLHAVSSSLCLETGGGSVQTPVKGQLPGRSARRWAHQLVGGRDATSGHPAVTKRAPNAGHCRDAEGKTPHPARVAHYVTTMGASVTTQITLGADCQRRSKSIQRRKCWAVQHGKEAVGGCRVSGRGTLLICAQSSYPRRRTGAQRGKCGEEPYGRPGAFCYIRGSTWGDSPPSIDLIGWRGAGRLLEEAQVQNKGRIATFATAC